MYRAYILSKSARSPRFRTERENWVQRVVADGHAICILPERSAAAPGLVTRPIEGLFGAGIGDRECLWIDGTGPDGKHVHVGGSAADILRRGADGLWRYIIDNNQGTAVREPA